MSTIGGRIVVSIIDDGSQLHTVLLSNKPLVQFYTGSTGDPDWTQPENQPTIYLDVKNGTTTVPVDSNSIKWYHNGSILNFDATTGISGNFKKTTYGADNVPALKIIGNLAQSENVSEETIMIEGSATVNGASVPFRAYIPITISFFQANGGYGSYITKQGNGGFVLDSTTSSLTLYNVLRQRSATGTSTVGANEYWSEWYINGTQITDTSKVGTITIDGTQYSKLTIVRDDIADYAIVECRAYQKVNSAKGDFIITSSVEVNDMLDDEMMYISSQLYENGSPVAASTSETGEGNENTLRYNQSINYRVSVAKATDPVSYYTSYTNYYIQLRTNLNTVYTGSLSGSDLGTPIASGEFAGYRKLSADLSQNYWGGFTLTYSHIVQMGGKISGYIIASTEALS